MAAPTVQPVIDRLQMNRERFESFCRSLTEEELRREVPNSEWTVRDFIIHLTAFDDLCAAWVEGVIAGRTDTPAMSTDGGPFDIDAWNNARVAEWRGKSLDEMFAEAKTERAKFIEALGKLTDEQMQIVVDFPGDNKRDPAKVPFGLFLHGLARHDPVHVADMVKALPEKAADPEIEAWLDDRMVEWYQQAMAGPPKR